MTTEEKRQGAFTMLRSAAQAHAQNATSTEECPFKEGTAFRFDWIDAFKDAQVAREQQSSR